MAQTFFPQIKMIKGNADTIRMIALNLQVLIRLNLREKIRPAYVNRLEAILGWLVYAAQ